MKFDNLGPGKTLEANIRCYTGLLTTKSYSPCHWFTFLHCSSLCLTNLLCSTTKAEASEKILIHSELQQRMISTDLGGNRCRENSAHPEVTQPSDSCPSYMKGNLQVFPAIVFLDLKEDGWAAHSSHLPFTLRQDSTPFTSTHSVITRPSYEKGNLHWMPVIVDRSLAHSSQFPFAI